MNDIRTDVDARSVREESISTTVIECRDLCKSYGPTRALNGVALRVGQGEMLAIVGASGSGKSTLLHCLSGLEKPDSGEVRAFGEVVTGMREPRLTSFRRSHFGFMFQFPSLIPELSALENVALVGWMTGMERKRAKDRAHELLSELGVVGRAGSVPGQLSGGEAQRVALARALVNSPSVIFADEPTGALDSENARAVIDLLSGMSRRLGCAVLLVTHDPSIAAVADQILRLHDGSIVALS